MSLQKNASQQKGASGLGLVFVVILIVGSFLAGHFYGNDFLPNARSTTAKQIEVVNKDEPAQEQLDMTLFWRVVDLINERFLFDENIDSSKLLNGAISGMVAALGDPYTSFYTPDQNEQFTSNLEGVYEGIGAQLGYNEENLLVIVAPLEDSPAVVAGLRPQDIILAVDGESTRGWSIPQAVDRIRGEANSEVTLTIYREKGEPQTQEIAVARKEIHIPAVRTTWVEKDGQPTKIAHVRILRFGSDTIGEWQNQVNDLKANGVEGIILDVRNNPGGYLNAAIYLGSEFFNDGVIVKRESNDGVQEFPIDHPCKLCDTPVVVLVNEGSASASEILAGAIQARTRGELIGKKSFGKGTVQDAIDLPQGTALHVTSAKWLLPNDQNIHGAGLLPDIEVETDISSGPFATDAKDAQLNAAIEKIQEKVAE